MSTKVLIAGIGNVFFGDDGFGVAVVDVLCHRSLPPGVRVVDFGIRGFDLASAMVDDQDAVILIDTAARGGAPGSLYVIDLDAPVLAGPQERELVADGHSLNVTQVLQTVDRMGGRARWVKLVGCEPLTFGPDDEPTVGLSAPVEAAVAVAADLVEAMLRALRGEAVPPTSVALS